MENDRAQHPHLVKSPKLDIPLGEAIIADNGCRYGLKIKKPKSNKYEYLWLDELFALIDREIHFRY